MNVGAEIWQAVVVCVSAIFTQNILLAYFLGLCPFIGVSREIKAAFGLGLAVIFVITCTTILNWIAYNYVLVPLNLEFFRFILFIIIIAAFVQFVEMVIERYSPFLYQQLGVFLPLITVNCAILGVSLFTVLRDNPRVAEETGELVRNYSAVETFAFGLGSGLGWMLAICAMAGIREKMRRSRVPKGLEGPGITLIITGIMALAFIGLAGVLRAN
jgi:Na+-transporting NADH:ubiquinone oxidoreductase subunit E